ncbi:hypothetical protein M9H77_01521 [Catharanthus roseus]|uniref:Uncharacterized protein n=1 Tax=Catharanthus roseus TaxID=4058 RepID=A0ACC0C659_CATRO|nr:hypothetical protein M9H77_01521 [Catharanthus roseus]
MQKSTAEGEGRLETEFVNIETASDSLDSSVVFHVVTDVLAFVLYMHQQIPSVLQDITLEFEELQNEQKDLTVVLQSEMKASLRRTHTARKREVKQGLRRMEKLMRSIANLKDAFQHLITEIPDIERVTLVLGASPLRPLQVYELCFSHEKIVPADFSRTRIAEGLSRKAIRTLISRGAGSDRSSYSGPSKLFLLVKAPAYLNLPLHFLPKRDFKYNKKIVPFKLRFQRRKHYVEADTQSGDAGTAKSLSIESSSNDSIWFQCRHVIKGLPSETAATED